MEAPELTRPTLPARDQPAPVPGQPGAPSGQVASHLTLGPVILPSEQGLAPAVFLKALPIPLYHTVPPGGLQPCAPLVTRSLDGGGVPFLLSPLLRPEGLGPTQVGKPALTCPALTVNIVGTLPVLSPGLGPTLGSPGKVRNAGKHLCPHCGRDCLKPSVLEKHIRSHTGERPFPCATCGIAFKTQSNLYKHRRTQTHLNHSRLSSESDGGGGSLLEEGDRAGESSRADDLGDITSQRVGSGARSETSFAQGAGHCPVPAMHLSSVAKTLGLKLEAVPCPGSTLADRETPVDSAHMASPGLTLPGSQPRWKLPEQTSPTVGQLCSPQQQQAATSSEKSRDTRASEGQLRKCESTDSGYLSRSDSAEQPPAPGSPLRGLSEHSAESEGDVALGSRGPGLQLEKKQLEERIAWLISHNQAVVDDSQLDNVRPRKTVLCKQGSIDLPMPYTYKDSFHFDIRALQPGRRKPAALSSARSTFTPPEKARPLFFHSVPTQLSTTVACVPVTRSNSLPFVESTRTWQEALDPQDICPRRQKPLSPRPAPTQLVDVPSGHPRALVRQAAVEDLPCPPTGDSLVPAEDPDGSRAAAGEGAANKGRAASKKCRQRKLKMFSQDKWQVYGNETFKRIYQKMKTSCHGGKKAKEMTVGSGTELDLPLQEELVGNEGTIPSQDRRTSVRGDTSVVAKAGPCQSPLTSEGFLVIEFPKQKEMGARAGGSEQPRVNRATSPPTLSCREPSCLGSKSPLLSLNRMLEPGCQLCPVPGPLKRGDLEALRLVLPDRKLEEGTCGDGDKKEICQWTQTVLRRPSGSSGEPQPSEDKLPSERKKLKVEKLSCQEQLEPLGTERKAPDGPVQATSPPSQKEDSDPGDKPGEPHENADGFVRGRAGKLGRSLELPGTTSVTLAAPRQAGQREILPCPAATSLGHQSHLATQAPGILVALADTAFPPKYLLRLPQGETIPPPPVAWEPGQDQDPVYRRRQPENQASFVGLGLGTLLPSCPVSGLVPSEADSLKEGPSCSRPCGRRKGVQGEERRDLGPGSPAAGQSPGSSTDAPGKTTSFLPTPTCATQRSGPPDIRHLCTGSAAVGARSSGSVTSPCALRDLGRLPANAQEDPLLEPVAGLSSSCSFTALTPPGWPELALCTHSETLQSFRAHGPFPSLRAEPRLTWCCLSRSLPLPTEQKEKAASVYLALHFVGGNTQDKGPDTQPVSRAVVGGEKKTGLGEGGQVQTSKLSCPVASGIVSQEQVSEPEGKKGLLWRKAKMFRGSSKQKLSIRSRRYKGSFLQSHVQLRGSGPRRPLRVLRKDRHLPQIEGLGPRATCRQPSSEMAGLNLQEEPCHASSESPVDCGHREEKEDSSRQTSGSFSPSTSSRAGRGIDHITVKAISLAAGGHSNCHPQNTAAGSGLLEHSDSCVALANDSLLSRGRGLRPGLLDTQPLPSQEQVSVDLKPNMFLDAQEPSSSESRGTSPCQDVTPVATICAVGERAGHTTLGIHSMEPQNHRTAGEALTQSSPDGKARVEGMSTPVLPGRPSSGQRISGLVFLKSTRKTHLEILASGPDSASSYQEEGEHKTFFPTGGHYGCGEIMVPCPPLGNDSGKCQGPGLIALKDRVVPSNPGQPRESPEAPSKIVKRRGLEGLRKQTRVEVSDTSSDDEDRLVIEM